MDNRSARKRASKIARLAAPAVRAALARGDITVRRADIFSGLPRRRQERALARWLGERENKRRIYRQAAGAIEEYLAGLGVGAKPALPELAERIRDALA